jgi:hypothetical protein
LSSREFHDREREEIDGRFLGHFNAAEQFARLVAPGDDILIGELWSHFRSSSAFAAKYPDWFLTRWHFESIDIDWYGIDFNPWSYLQDCLGVRNRLAVVPWDSSPERALELVCAIAPALKSSFRPTSDLTLPDFLRTAGLYLEKSGSTLVQLVDNWSDEIVLIVVPAALVAQLGELARAADVYKAGLRDLRTQALVTGRAWAAKGTA